ncbi:lysosomal alpha-glucosidase-like isoform X1 [Ptychodera flava]|uniref:lysosomal alpha-glucosidase-like isoform X1 n=1 Tax=Ptychodera flava TaxID=63121 RepID=UPI003969E52B
MKAKPNSNGGTASSLPKLTVTLFLLVTLLSVEHTLASQCITQDSLRFDCYPEQGSTRQKCEDRGCCWREPSASVAANLSATTAVPYCFYPLDYPTYSVKALVETNFGYRADLVRSTKTYYPKDVMHLRMDVLLETDNWLHFKIYDPNNSRYEVPIETPMFTNKSTSPLYTTEFGKVPFSFQVRRQANQMLLFDTSVSNLIFTDQFIQISTRLPSSYLYGLGESYESLLLDLEWKTKTMWTRDQHPGPDTNLYGAHPFYMVMESDGNSHGVFLLNSNAMDIVLQPTPALTYRTIGGILDFYVFLGPTPTEVVQQYLDVIGKPFLPPYWSLGFHLCRYGYKTANRTLEVVERMRAANIPQDVQWNDIDSMDGFRDFTVDPDTFSSLPSVIDNLHMHGQHYVVMLDPAISSTQPKGTYPPFDEGVAKDVFVKNATGDILIGKVWPGESAYPDFTNNVTHQWWTNQISKFHQLVKYDGLWNDMNEPSDFVFGSVDGCPFNNTYEMPPYMPAVRGGALQESTICASAQQAWSLHYDVHNLYGYSETMATHMAIEQALNKRAFVLSRSTFSGSGKYTAHWTGDIGSTWQDLYYTLPGMLNFNMFGIPMIGADICGFAGNTTEQLCQRWQQVGAFYPFSRNHNALANKDQDPTVFSKAMQDSTRKALLIRYSLLPYLYTLLHRAHQGGYTVARPLFFEFTKDLTTYSIDNQFLWGESLLISPVIVENATSVYAYFPNDRWYDYYTGSQVETGWKTLHAPMDTINLHLRGGFILPTQEPDMTTTASRKKKFGLIVSLSADNKANGELFWDDGDTIDTFDKGLFEAIMFSAANNSVTSSVKRDGYPDAGSMLLGNARILGVQGIPTKVTANGNPVQFEYDIMNKVLNVTGMSLPMRKNFNITWS